MTNILKTTRQIHETIDLINAKYGLNINIESGSKIATEWTISSNTIRQILIAFKDLLGENPKFTELENAIKNLKDGHYNRYVMCVTHIVNGYIPQSKAEALCHKWLDGLNPLFDSEPELVLEELLEVLQNLIK